MAATFTYLAAFVGLLIAIFKDYLKVNKIWVRKSEQVVADSISITALIIGLLNSLPYLVLVLFVYKDWLVTLRTLSDIVRALVTLLIGIGFWVGANRGIPVRNLFLQALNFGSNQKHRYEMMVVPHNEAQMTAVRERNPDLTLVSRRGGQVFVFELDASPKNVSNVIQEYQDLGLYVTYQRMDQSI